MHALRRTHIPPVLVILASVVLLAACSSAASPPPLGISVTGAWARSTPATAGTSAAYATITNAGTTADALIGASSPVATSAEVHETMTMGSPAASSGGMMGSPAASSGGMMGMQPVSRVEITAGGSLQLQPGSYHVMLIGLTSDLVTGETIDLTLIFEKAGPITVKAEVRAS